MSERRQAVVDLGSNSFRLVVFTWHTDGARSWWKRTDEIHEPVRIGQGLDATGALQVEPMGRALGVLELYAHFCRATDIDDVRPVATSAIRDASNQSEFMKVVNERRVQDVEVL
jgi:exopolyphosphatase/guanosine-5'-triphosphate,3'-diphosphate pyrophosphatase